MRIVCQTILMKSYGWFFWKLGKISQNLSSAAIVICALRVIFFWFIGYLVKWDNVIALYFLFDGFWLAKT